MIESSSICSECLNIYIELNIFYDIPAVWETEEIHKTGTGNVGTSKGHLKQLFISPYDGEEPWGS